MEARTYECQYCRKEYVPKRRGVQKFCSNSCRVRSHQLKNKTTTVTTVTKDKIFKLQKTKIDQMSIAAIGNSTVGNLLAEGVSKFITREENKPATKKDIRQLELKIKQNFLKIEKRLGKTF